ncbi:hypothetical protein Scep_006101 [Stephania cephalantha]|uniref:C2 domain-containing protein n=1 Tax=Stephania cephalantha TaxID=152367 RepID=A0AAP0K8X7_9MAGN
MGTPYLLEINLISAQGLKPPPAAAAVRRRLETYAVVWVDPAHKIRTRVDIVGGENPTWNDKFIFRVDADFLSGDTSAVSVEIFAVGFLKDPLIGTVRFLFGNCLNLNRASSSSSSSSGGGAGFSAPAFTAVQIRRPSGRFHGVLNIGAAVMSGSGSDFAAALHDQSAIGYRDLMGESHRSRIRRRRDAKTVEEADRNSGDCASDGVNSSCSSSPSSTTLKDWNARKQDLAGKKDRSGAKEALMCGFKKFQRKIHLSPSDQNLPNLHLPSDDENRKPEI